MTVVLELVQKLDKDLKQAAKQLSPSEARYLVDAYYTIQEYRKATGNQKAAMGEEPNEVVSWFFDQHFLLEKNIQKVLDIYTEEHPVGKWMKSTVGIGPVISAGLLAHIDITKAPTVGHIWSFAGLNPEAKWEKGQRRPWNARLKVLQWKIGESFVKVCNNPKDFYGKLYKERKELEIQRNERLEFKAQAEQILASKKIGKNTDAYAFYSIGKLPPAHIHARAKRYAVKLFLAALHEVWYTWHYGTAPPLPYPIAMLGHAHKIEPPNMSELSS